MLMNIPAKIDYCLNRLGKKIIFKYIMTFIYNF